MNEEDDSLVRICINGWFIQRRMKKGQMLGPTAQMIPSQSHSILLSVPMSCSPNPPSQMDMSADFQVKHSQLPANKITTHVSYPFAKITAYLSLICKQTRCLSHRFTVCAELGERCTPMN